MLPCSFHEKKTLSYSSHSKNVFRGELYPSAGHGYNLRKTACCCKIKEIKKQRLNTLKKNTLTPFIVIQSSSLPHIGTPVPSTQPKTIKITRINLVRALVNELLRHIWSI